MGPERWAGARSRARARARAGARLWLALLPSLLPLVLHLAKHRSIASCSCEKSWRWSSTSLVPGNITCKRRSDTAGMDWGGRAWVTVSEILGEVGLGWGGAGATCGQPAPAAAAFHRSSRPGDPRWSRRERPPRAHSSPKRSVGCCRRKRAARGLRRARWTASLCCNRQAGEPRAPG